MKDESLFVGSAKTTGVTIRGKSSDLIDGGGIYEATLGATACNDVSSFVARCREMARRIFMDEGNPRCRVPEAERGG